MAFKSVYGSKWMRSAAAFFLLCAMLLPAVFSAHAEGGNSGDLTPECKVALPERSACSPQRQKRRGGNARISR